MCVCVSVTVDFSCRSLMTTAQMMMLQVNVAFAVKVLAHARTAIEAN